MLNLRTVLWAFAMVAFPALGQTVTLFDSTGDTIDSTSSISGSGPLGFSFSTGGSSVNLTQVQLSVTNPTNCEIGSDDLLRNSRPRFLNANFVYATTAVSPSITVQLYSNNVSGPQPGSALTTIGTVLDSSVSTCRSLLTLPLTTPFTLAANTRFWIVLSTGNSSVLEINLTNTASGAGVLGEFFFGEGSTITNDTAFIASVTGTANAPTTAAPASLLLTLAGLACVGLWLGRRRFSRQSL